MVGAGRCGPFVFGDPSGVCPRVGDHSVHLHSFLIVIAKMWEKWKTFAHALGRFQTKLILNLFYYVALAPVGALCRWRVNPLGLGRTGGRSAWTYRKNDQDTLDSLKEQS